MTPLSPTDLSVTWLRRWAPHGPWVLTAIDADEGFAEWHAAIAPLAARPNVFCKLSGLLTECGSAPHVAIEPYAGGILELFGSERTMWGSDWPVLELAAGYGEWLELARDCVPVAAQEDVFARTAARFYGLEA